jgi:hypothetical protein
VLEEEEKDDQAAIPATATVTPQEAAQILHEISEADRDDDWAEYVSWQ